MTASVVSERTFAAMLARLDVLTVESDNLIMADISATEASKRFADMLDAVEHRGEVFTVVRRGQAIATISPARRHALGELRAFLEGASTDPDFERDIEAARLLLGDAPIGDPWSG